MKNLWNCDFKDVIYKKKVQLVISQKIVRRNFLSILISGALPDLSLL